MLGRAQSGAGLRPSPRRWNAPRFEILRVLPDLRPKRSCAALDRNYQISEAIHLRPATGRQHGRRSVFGNHRRPVDCVSRQQRLHAGSGAWALVCRQSGLGYLHRTRLRHLQARARDKQASMGPRRRPCAGGDSPLLPAYARRRIHSAAGAGDERHEWLAGRNGHSAHIPGGDSAYQPCARLHPSIPSAANSATPRRSSSAKLSSILSVALPGSITVRE